MYYAVIMAGGSGTRLWPLSRQDRPKQALRLVGDKTMFQYAVERIRSIFPPERIFIVTRAAHASILSEQVSDLPVENFILEPEARNTAPALGLSALHLNRVDPDGIMVVLAADHSIRKSGEFLDLLRMACDAAKNDYLVTLGIKPDRPETGYGYIKAGAPLKEAAGDDVRAVEAFVEKPDRPTAEEYVRSGRYFWNSGIFVMLASAWLAGRAGRCRGSPT